MAAAPHSQRRSAARLRRLAGRVADAVRSGSRGAARKGGAQPYPGDLTSAPRISYEPHPDDLPDPGEVVWTWVPYEEDHSQGKDRPVLVIGRDGGWLLALQLTSQDHDGDAEDEARHGRYWVDVGVGDWDRDRRPSEARVDRVLRMDPDRVRRIGAVLARDRFEEVAAGVRRHAGS